MSKNQFNNAEENQVKEKKARGKAGTPKGDAAGRSPAAKRQQSQGGNAKKAPAKNTSAKNTPAKQKNSTEAVSEPKRNTYQRKRKAADTTPLRITPLGGLGEIGKNITLYEYGDDMFLVDCGMSFPDEEMPGIDIVIPDFTYVIKNADKIKGLVVTHGHEDHIGAIPYLLKECNFPIYGTALTLGLVEGKLREHKLLDRANLNTIKPGDKVKFGKFTVEFIHVNHSIPDAVAVAVETPVGTVVQTGDFKIDTTPIDGDVIDLGGGVKIEVAEVEGHTPGSVVFIDRAHKCMFTGDAFGLWMQVPLARPISEYKAAVLRLKEKLQKPGYTELAFLGGHRRQEGGEDPQDKYVPNSYEKIDDMLTLCDLILEKKIEAKPFPMNFGEPAFISTYKTAYMVFMESVRK